MSSTLLKNEAEHIELRVFHIGGRGGVGPIKCLFRLKENLLLSIFEANMEEDEDRSWHNYDKLVEEYANKYGINVSVIPRCISNSVGKRNFNINVMPDSSSLFKVSPEAEEYSRMDRGKYRIIWGEICQPQRTVEIDVTTLDELHANGEIQTPHFLSMDVQGAEYNILEAAASALHGDLMGVVTEVEFRELYDGQKLFTDQYELLKEYQFRLFDLLNTEYWFSGPIAGKGAIVVAEALFLRDFQYFVGKYQEPTALLMNLLKLAIISLLFERKSYAFEILEYIMNNFNEEWHSFVRKNHADYLKKLDIFHRKMKKYQHRMERIPTYQEYIAKHPDNKPNIRSFLSSCYDLNLRMIVEKLKRRF